MEGAQSTSPSAGMSMHSVECKYEWWRFNKPISKIEQGPSQHSVMC